MPRIKTSLVPRIKTGYGLMQRIKTRLWPDAEDFPPREILVSDIPAGDGQMANLFLQCRIKTRLWPDA